MDLKKLDLIAVRTIAKQNNTAINKESSCASLKFLVIIGVIIVIIMFVPVIKNIINSRINKKATQQAQQQQSQVPETITINGKNFKKDPNDGQYKPV
jgi:uncharacterized alpha/beta hydrolase family protein